MPAKSFGSQIDLRKIPVLGLVPETAPTASPPANPVNGQFWYDSTVNRLKVYENGGWVVASTTGVEFTANKGAANGYASLDGTTKVPITQLPTGTTGSTVALGNDSRFTDARNPTGDAGGSLAGTYPNPTLAAGAVGSAEIASAIKDAAAGTASLRTLGTGAQQALAGNTRLDTIASPTGPLSLNSQRITNLAAPTADTDAATKLYVDSARAGLRLKDAVRVATTGNITLSGTQTIDGVAVVAGDRVLVKDQTAGAANGIYVVAAGAWARASDADSAAEINDGATTFVQEGTGQANTTWTQINTITTLGTDVQSWAQQGAAVSYTWGAGLGNTVNDVYVNVDNSSIEINADALRIKAGGVTNAMLAGSIDLTTKVTGALPVANGGTGATTAAAARTALGAVGKYAATLGALTAGSEATITHNLNSTDVIAGFRNASTGYDEFLNWRVIDANSIGVTADVAYSASALRVTVVG